MAFRRLKAVYNRVLLTRSGSVGFYTRVPLRGTIGFYMMCGCRLWVSGLRLRASSLQRRLPSSQMFNVHSERVKKEGALNIDQKVGSTQILRTVSSCGS